MSTPPTITATPAPVPVTMAEYERGRDGVLVLVALRARRRDPSATIWTVVSYDPHARVPTVDIARWWRPVGAGPGAGAVPEPVARWIGEVLGGNVAVSAPADDLAGPRSWHIHRFPDGPT